MSCQGIEILVVGQYATLGRLRHFLGVAPFLMCPFKFYTHTHIQISSLYQQETGKDWIVRHFKSTKQKEMQS